MTATSERGFFLLRKAHEIAADSKVDTGDVDAVLILATAGLEAFLNGLEHLADATNVDSKGRLKALGQILGKAEEGKAQPLLKYELAYFVLARQTIDRGSGLYQAFSRLVALRNDLVHLKPIEGCDSSAKLATHRHVRFFLSRGIITRSDLSGHRTWDRAVLTPAVAQWGYATAIDTIVALIDLMPQCPARKELRNIFRPDYCPAPTRQARSLNSNSTC